MKDRLIRINLNRKESFIKKLLTADLTALREDALNTFLALAFVGGILLIPPAVFYYFTLKSDVEELKRKVEQERKRREALMAQIRRLQEQVRRAKLRKEVYERVHRYNLALLEALKEKPLPVGVSLQNFSACAFEGKRCSLKELKSPFELKNPALQMDLVLLRDGVLEELKADAIKKQTYVEVAGVPIKRVCVVKEKKEEEQKAQ
ncbi:MAG: hypothetical protein GXO03_01460 [Aquificae bacterium]|nr:hypothetical protein [Aquificota bacterium]